MTTLERLRDKANSLPLTPGVYLMKNADGQIIYVGKSKALKHRVTSYFTGNHHTYKTDKLVSHIEDFDFIVCDTEMEALTLENVLIKKHTPKYNIKLKDAKSYPYIKVTNDTYPALLVTRERRGDKAKYFGPYQGVAQAYTALETVRKIFFLPSCKRQFPRDIGKERPCIYLDMGRCVGPCTGKVGVDAYVRAVKQAEDVLNGNIRQTVKRLESDMFAAAEDCEFERAATLRDSIRSLEKLLDKQKVVADTHVNRDVFALYSSESEGVLAMLSVRGGAVIHKTEFILTSLDLSDAEDAMQLVVDYYEGQADIPTEIILDFSLTKEDVTLLSDYLSLQCGKRIHVRIPERGEGRKLCDLALENAAEAARQHRLDGERENKSLKRFSELLALPEVPHRIEAYDISNFGNEAIVGAMIVCEDGKLKKADYRLFSVKTTDGADDYGSMREVLSRRLAHIGDGTPSLGETPDVILLDGGATHVKVVRDLMKEEYPEISLFGMVKDDFHKTRAITDGQREISIAQEPNVYTFVYTLQEEVHRFAIKESRKTKEKALTHSTLEHIDGIGPAKAKKMLKVMPIGKIRQSTAQELTAIEGISRKDADAIVAYYHKEKKRETK